MLRLTDLQLVLLSKAAQRADGLVPIAGRLHGSAARTFARRLITLGLAEPFERDDGGQTGCGDASKDCRDEGEQDACDYPVPLLKVRITGAGLAALNIGERQDRDASCPASDGVREALRSAQEADTARERSPTPGQPQGMAFGTKGRILKALVRKAGVTIRDLAEETGWQPHSLRAALSGLRKAGYRIETSTNERGTRYRLMEERGQPDAMIGGRYDA